MWLFCYMPLFLLSANKVVRTMQGCHCASSLSGIFLTKFTNIPYVYCLCGIAMLLVQYSGTGSFSVQNSGFCTVKQALLPHKTVGFVLCWHTDYYTTKFFTRTLCQSMVFRSLANFTPFVCL